MAIDQRLMECKRWHPPLVRGQGRATRSVYLSPRQFCKWCLYDYARSACNSKSNEPAKVNETILACNIWYFNNLLRFVSKRLYDTDSTPPFLSHSVLIDFNPWNVEIDLPSLECEYSLDRWSRIGLLELGSCSKIGNFVIVELTGKR